VAAPFKNLRARKFLAVRATKVDVNRRTWLWPVLVGVACTGLTPSGSATPAVPAVRIVVAYARSSGEAETAVERSAGALRIASIPQLRVHVLGVPATRADEVLAELRSSPIVRSAKRDARVNALRIPDDEFWPGEWSPRKTRAPEAWNLTTGSASVVVAVVDSGVDASQPDLRAKLVPGYDFVNGDATPGDDNGHGTAVAGVVAATSDNGIGVAGYCWRCRLMPVKVLGADGSGFASTVAQGIVWATDHGARVINASLGGPDYDVAGAAAAQYAASHGALVVAAAGNDSSPVLDYPAALPGVLSVGASDPRDRLYAFSNSGAAVAAPGENLTTGRNGEYVKFVGTSSATPVVSGIAALALSAAPEVSPADLMRGLEQTASRSTASPTGGSTRMPPCASLRRASLRPRAQERAYDAECRAASARAGGPLPSPVALGSCGRRSRRRPGRGNRSCSRFAEAPGCSPPLTGAGASPCVPG
jgi:subtilisin family serine protease